ncbi:MAG: CBS domain-containing protein [Gammaproteobacteria bacterium]|nr:CBS domain-containing protein [Gammaproteobacteria bacterium]
MKDWRQTLVSPAASIHDTIQTIDTGSMQIALVVDAKHKLLGTVTDGDIRRAILKGISLDEPVCSVMNPHPVTVDDKVSDEQILAGMKHAGLHRIPVVTQDGTLVRLAVLGDLIQPAERPNPVVLMAGGLGTRLHPLTYESPKPMLEVGNKPVLQTIIENFREQGFVHFFLSVNYKAEIIKTHFGNGSRLDINIRYLHEKKRLGTGGALTLLPEQPHSPTIVMNGDLLTKVDFRHLLDFHSEHNAKATMCVRKYDFQVPYGVVEIDRQRILSIQEKPVHQFFVNAGIYVLEPDTLSMIPRDTYFEMPALFEKLLEQQEETVVFPIREYWIDIGQMADLERANTDFNKTFSVVKDA